MASAPAGPAPVIAGRGVASSVLSNAQMDGEGAEVRRSIGTRALPRLDPFLMLDEFNVAAPAGFPPHGHRGFSTVTYMLSGAFTHEDFKGHKGTLRPGDLQWMTAGKGIVHSELPEGTAPGHGLQLWVNLPRSLKMCEPEYQELLREDIPEATSAGVRVKVIAGSALGVEARVRTRTPVHYLDITLEPGAVFSQPLDSSWNAFLYILSGEALIGAKTAGEVASGKRISAHHTVVLTKAAGQDGVVVGAGAAGVHCVLISGQPIGEPVAQYGPVVMTNETELAQFFEDFRGGKNGFEGARQWMAEWDARHDRD